MGVVNSYLISAFAYHYSWFKKISLDCERRLSYVLGHTTVHHG